MSRTRRSPLHRPSGRRRGAAVAVAVAALLTGCAGSDQSATDRGAADSGADHEAGHAAAGALPSSHVHGVAVNPADGLVHLATHDGLFRYDEQGPTRVGPVIDLMGFTVAGPDHFYASGHPGPGTDLPEPVGLLESTDGGETWVPLSRQGESDFHAMTASAAGVVGFDGVLRTTADGEAWTALDPPVTPYALAASPDGAVLLATSESGPVRSGDAGASWSRVEGAPLLLVVDWAGEDTAVGVTPDGTVAVSTDAGATWTQRASVDGPPQAVGADLLPSGEVRVLVVTADGIAESLDGGATFPG